MGWEAVETPCLQGISEVSRFAVFERRIKENCRHYAWNLNFSNMTCGKPRRKSANWRLGYLVPPPERIRKRFVAAMETIPFFDHAACKSIAPPRRIMFILPQFLRVREEFYMKLSRTLLASTAVAIVGSMAQAAPVPVDLSSWVAEGNGTWTRAADNNSVFQSRNGSPTVFHNDSDSQGKSLTGTISVTGSDDDFIGFVLGYQAGDLASSTADYLVIDWKQQTQPFYSACDNSIDGIAGLAISRVTGPLSDIEGWCHNGDVTELARADTLGSTGWATGTTYNFDLEFSASNVKVFVNGVKEIDINGTFADGAFGFYNFSQASVTYAGLEEEILPPSEVPLPAGLPLMLAGLGAFGYMRRRQAA